MTSIETSIFSEISGSGIKIPAFRDVAQCSLVYYRRFGVLTASIIRTDRQTEVITFNYVITYFPSNPPRDTESPFPDDEEI